MEPEQAPWSAWEGPELRGVASVRVETRGPEVRPREPVMQHEPEQAVAEDLPERIREPEPPGPAAESRVPRVPRVPLLL